MKKLPAREPKLIEAYNLAAASIFSAISPNGTHEEYFETVVLLASLAVCGSGRLTEKDSRHNADIFHARLNETITEIMKLRLEPKTTKRMM